MIEILRIVYSLCALLLALYTLGQLVLLLLYIVHRRKTEPLPVVHEWPTVTVQLPLYNERYVITRLLDAVAALDYPHAKLTVQILDDSDDDTPEVIAAWLDAKRSEANRPSHVKFEHLRRPQRSGYKAGALAYGLERTDADLIAVFDADFVPPADFLRQTVPYFTKNPELGIVQTRWGHLNAGANLLTRAQALSIDAHFIIEQTARNRGGLLLTFNGTGGLWRRQCIQDAGGWSDDTLTEDLDLSYRAQIKGWRYLFLPELVVPGEVPPQIDAYKRQQARWAKGSNQSLIKLLPYLWRGRLTLAQRIMALQHLCQYLPHPLMFIMLLLTPPMLIWQALDGLPLAPLGIIGLIPPLIHLVAQSSLYEDWAKRLLAFPVVMVIGAGMVWNNTVAAWEAFTGHKGEFKRTPKFAQSWLNTQYILPPDRSIYIETSLGLYALVGCVMSLWLNPAVAPFLGLYAVSFGAVAFRGIRDRWLALQQRPTQDAQESGGHGPGAQNTRFTA